LQTNEELSNAVEDPSTPKKELQVEGKKVNSNFLTNSLLLAQSNQLIDKLKVDFPLEQYRPNYKNYVDRSQTMRNSVGDETARGEEMIKKSLTSGTGAASAYANLLSRKTGELNKINANELNRMDSVTTENNTLSNAAEEKRIQLNNAMAERRVQGNNEKLSAKNLAMQTFVEGANTQENLDSAQRIEIKTGLLKAYSSNPEVIENLKKSMNYKGTTEEFLNDFMRDNQKNSVTLPRLRYRAKKKV
jgi:hypothetical protein